MEWTRTTVAHRLNGNAAASVTGDHVLNPDMAAVSLHDLTPAAVLIGLVERDAGLTLLLTQRSVDLEHHPGQISFPGGHVDDDDKTAEACALRELEEETGIPTRHVHVAGRLPTYTTRTGFAIAPVVGFITPPFSLRPDPREVADIFEVPFDFLMDTANHQRMSRDFNGKTRYFHAMSYEDHYIWGATAGMLVNLHAALTGEHGS